MVEKTVGPILILSFMVLVGCQTIQPEQEQEPETDFDVAIRHEPEVFGTGDAESERDSFKPDVVLPDQVVKQLQKEALELQSQGRWGAAELKLERALRIDTQQSELYEQLATVRMGQSRFVEAEQIALKGLSIPSQTSEQKVALWQVIVQCRSATGDIAGARAARKEVEKWQ
ncbi:MAG: hypothetical protein P8X74_18920 [Reinekea sp.]